jgi:hypothetical protein
MKEYSEQLALWEKEDRLVYAIRDCIHRKFDELRHLGSILIPAGTWLV